MTLWTKRTGANTSTTQSWTTATRPSSPIASTCGLNTDFNGLEVYNGTAWVILNGSWTTATRPSTDIASGSQGFNSDTGMGLEFYDGTNWRHVA